MPSAEVKTKNPQTPLRASRVVRVRQSAVAYSAARKKQRLAALCLAAAGRSVEACHRCRRRNVRRGGVEDAPLLAVAGRKAASTAPWLTVEGAGAIAEALKPAADGDGWIVRIYEPHGGRGDVTVTPPANVSAVIETNLVEENETEIDLRDGSFTMSLLPFQIRTFRLRGE